jgi:hypothetical protein
MAVSYSALESGLSVGVVESGPVKVGDDYWLTTDWFGVDDSHRPVTGDGNVIMSEARTIDGHGNEHVLIAARYIEAAGKATVVQRSMTSCPSCGSTRSDIRQFGSGLKVHYEMNAKNPKACMHEYHGRYRPGLRPLYTRRAS